MGKDLFSELVRRFEDAKKERNNNSIQAIEPYLTGYHDALGELIEWATESDDADS